MESGKKGVKRGRGMETVFKGHIIKWQYGVKQGREMAMK
jgi:hypothetical protein